MSKKQFAVIGPDGRETICDILAAFENPENKKRYIIYTDNTKNELGQTNVYASRYNPETKEEGGLLPVDTDEEWKMINQVIQNLQQE